MGHSTRIIDLTGRTFGKLHVLAFHSTKPNGAGAYWLCGCEQCGQSCVVRGRHLRSGRTTRCRNCASKAGAAKLKAAGSRICKKCGTVKQDNNNCLVCKAAYAVIYRQQSAVKDRARQREQVRKNDPLVKRARCERAARKRARDRGTWKQFYSRRWHDINRRTINGYSPDWKSKPARCYLLRGVRLEMTRQEFRDWCLVHKDEIEQQYRDGLRPSINRKDADGHYCLDNIEVIPFTENCRLSRKTNGVTLPDTD